MAQAAGSPQRQHLRAGSLPCHPNLHLVGPVNDIAALCQLLLLLLLPLLSQDKDEGIEHLKRNVRHARTDRTWGKKVLRKTTKGLSLRKYSADIRDFSVSFERH